MGTAGLIAMNRPILPRSGFDPQLETGGGQPR